MDVSIATMILGQSGTGKTTSLRNMDPAQTLLIQVISKPLPFRSKDWKPVSKDGGNIIVSNMSDVICSPTRRTTALSILVHDFQYLPATEFMNPAHEAGYAKYTEMARHYYDVLTTAPTLAPEKRVYLLSHTDTSDTGQI